MTTANIRRTLSDRISRFLGGTLLVAGTTIGAGMLGNPIATGFLGAFPSALCFLIVWGFMLLSAFFFIDVILCEAPGTNFISMADNRLGSLGKWAAWCIYLVLLYSLLSAYIASSAPLFIKLFSLIHIQVPNVLCNLLLPLLFGSVIYGGTRRVDFLNRALMVGLVVSYCALIFFVPAHVQKELLTYMSFKPFCYAFPVVIVSFGYHIILPSLATYLDRDRSALYGVVILGSVIALGVYMLWNVLILGAVPLTGEDSLGNAWKAGVPITATLANITQSPAIVWAVYGFSFFAVVTSFVGVALSLSDFLIDGLCLAERKQGRMLATLLTYIPPLFFVVTYQRAFIVALEYAGVAVALLLVLFPACMASTLTNAFYCRRTGKTLVYAAIIFAFFITIVDILIRAGYFSELLNSYL